jgi:hypothetical protein
MCPLTNPRRALAAVANPTGTSKREHENKHEPDGLTSLKRAAAMGATAALDGVHQDCFIPSKTKTIVLATRFPTFM